MMKVRPLVVFAGLVISSAAGCAEPGVIESNPAGAIMGTGGSKPAAGGTGGGSAAGASGAGAAGSTMATGGTGAAGTTMGSGGHGAGGTTVGTGGMGAGGSTVGTGGMGAGTGGAGAGGSGSGGEAALPDCPSGWTCEDPLKQLTDLGAEGTVTDPSGAPIKYACGNGGAVECDQANPKSSCPELPNAFCAHVMVGGLLAADLYSCAQLCTPKAP